MSTDAELLKAYRETFWRVDLPHGPTAIRLGQAAPPELRPAGIITAWNPASIPTSRPENEAANRMLRHALAGLGARYFSTLAGEGEWEEPGFAVLGLGQGELVSLGARLGQNAIVWIDESGCLSLIVARSGFCGHQIGDPIAPFTLARRSMLVKDRMTRDPVTVTPDDTLSRAMELTRAHRIRHLPVVTGNQRLAGILSDRDLRGAMPSPFASPEDQFVGFLASTPIASVMTREVITLAAHEPIENAARLMHRHRIGSLPVVDTAGRLLGIVTETDILQTFVEILGGAEPSSRIEVALSDEPGELARAVTILGGQLAINITSVVVPSLRAERRKVAILHLATINPQAAIQGLEAAGFEVGWPSLDADLRDMDPV